MFTTIKTYRMILTILLLIVINTTISTRDFNCVEFDSDICLDEDFYTFTNYSSDEQCPDGYKLCHSIECGKTVDVQYYLDGPADRGTHPWHAFIQDANNAFNNVRGYIGNGILIDQYHVLVTAHKITNFTNLNVIMGLFDLNDMKNTQTRSVVRYAYHKYYNNTTLENNIAILRLDSPINLGQFINYACLPPHNKLFNFDTCTIFDWNRNNFMDPNSNLTFIRYAKFPIIPMKDCIGDLKPEKLSFYLDEDKMICVIRFQKPGIMQKQQQESIGLMCHEKFRYFIVGLTIIWEQEFIISINVPYYTEWIEEAKNCLENNTECNQINIIQMFHEN